MKANELMIGDWIWDMEDRKPYQMTPLMVCGLIEHKENEGRVHPIYLTAEILEKNGFNVTMGKFDIPNSLIYECDSFNNYSKIHYEIYWDEHGTLIINSCDFDAENVAGNCDIDMSGVDYVHELQHALRLCGLTELADNFKVE